jgi:hypothetical protein
LESIADKIKSFNRNLHLGSRLPKGVSVLNPFQDNVEVNNWSNTFYGRFYADSQPRHLILGINPGRLGAGQTGIPFTDTKRLYEYFGLGSVDDITHESSSAYIYRMIDAYGGAVDFYSRYLISSVCPLGFVTGKNGKQLNFNYYDSPALQKAVTPFIVRCLEEQLQWPIKRDKVFCLGTGKNVKFLKDLNEKYRWFESIVSLEHPRYIMQYKAQRVDEYIEKYIQALRCV